MAWLITLLVILAVAAVAAYFWLRMPGQSFAGAFEKLTPDEEAIVTRLRTDLEHLAGTIGNRNLVEAPEQLEQAATWIENELTAAGWPNVERQEYAIGDRQVRNLIVEYSGSGSKAEEILVLGAHYDSAPECPAANDNGSGVVALLAFARRFASDNPPGANNSERRTLRLVFFTNEEPPFFQTPQMGSYVYALACRQRGDNIIGMMSLETMGYFSDEPNSQQFPAPALKAIYPTTGNYIAFVGSTDSKHFIEQVIGLFRKHVKFPSQATALPKGLPGIGWSDHWSFEVHGFRALMITDTAPFRYPHYHTPEDTPDKVQYPQLARVTAGLMRVAEGMLVE